MRKNYSSEFKARLVLEVLRGERTLSEIASENQVHPNMLTRWKTEAVKNFSQLFEKEASKTKQMEKQYEDKIDELYKQIGRLTTQNEWMKKKSDF
ncbi:transposase [Clostridium sp. WLY-B-L2]|jgi:transposase-like protein|uniref:Transposase n=1 Tax=Clostridium aromativorans TaxID=2836848 RepID=A0ABS8NAB7_9CLOT|nr:transposase [Clostridium aromativorans]MCC9296762.1 transposase [Clostridium aromativorans]